MSYVNSVFKNMNIKLDKSEIKKKMGTWNNYKIRFSNSQHEIKPPTTKLAVYFTSHN